LHLRRDNEAAIYNARLEQQRWIMDLAFHGDYEAFRADVGSTIKRIAGDGGAKSSGVANASIKNPKQELPAFFSAMFETIVREEVARRETPGRIENLREEIPDVTIRTGDKQFVTIRIKGSM
jgi:hypothetical protein